MVAPREEAEEQVAQQEDVVLAPAAVMIRHGAPECPL